MGACSCGGGVCADNEYCYEWIEDMGNGINYNYDCVACDSGLVPNDTCDGCRSPRPNPCPGYTTCPDNLVYSGTPRTVKCQEIVSGCPAGSGCTKYSLCHVTSGQISGYAVTDTCHLESGVCYQNSRPCSEFDVTVNGGSGNWTCNKADQTGTANWDDSSWDVGACQCSNTSIESDGCNAGVVVHQRTENFISSATSKIKYNQTRRYCRDCKAGKVPVVGDATSTVGGVSIMHYPVSHQPGWGVWKCATVTAPYYATGCEIDFSWAQTDVVDNCRASCVDAYHTITVSGATSASQCEIDDSVSYTDDTGTFTLSGSVCSGNGG